MPHSLTYFSPGLVLAYCPLNHRVKLTLKEDMPVCLSYTDAYIPVVKWLVNKEMLVIWDLIVTWFQILLWAKKNDDIYVEEAISR